MKRKRDGGEGGGEELTSQNKAREAQKTKYQMNVLASPQFAFTRQIQIKVPYSIHPRAFFN